MVILITRIFLTCSLRSSPRNGNAVKYFRTAGACPSVRSFGVLDSRRPTTHLRIRRTAKGGATNPEVSFSSRGQLEHQSGVRSGRARAGQSDKYQKSMSASVTCQNSHLSDATETLPMFALFEMLHSVAETVRGGKSRWLRSNYLTNSGKYFTGKVPLSRTSSWYGPSSNALPRARCTF